MKSFKIILTFGFIIVFFSCRNGNERQTKSGMKYIVYREANGKKPHAGDWVTVSMVYKEENDSVLFDSRSLGRPLRFALPAPKFVGSFEEGLLYIGEGDSATFFVNADSMFEKVIEKEQGVVTHRPKSGSNLKFDVSLLRVQPYQEAEMEMAMDESRQEKAEESMLIAYLKEKNLAFEKQPEGYYFQVKTPGKGRQINSGDLVSINYTGSLLNGVIVDNNLKSGKPYQFIVGNSDVIRGWDIAFQKLHIGDKAMLIIPSSLAYGEEGIQRRGSLTYLVPPFSTLIFDVEVLDSKASAMK
ncbi:FKBP-type peptidyl-prolyl cis-trans isomerase [soil metagenome]